MATAAAPAADDDEQLLCEVMQGRRARAQGKGAGSRCIRLLHHLTGPAAQQPPRRRCRASQAAPTQHSSRASRAAATCTQVGAWRQHARAHLCLLLPLQCHRQLVGTSSSQQLRILATPTASARCESRPAADHSPLCCRGSSRPLRLLCCSRSWPVSCPPRPPAAVSPAAHAAWASRPAVPAAPHPTAAGGGSAHEQRQASERPRHQD